MSEVDNENENTPVQTKPLFGGRQASTEPTGLQGLPAGGLNQLNAEDEAAQNVAENNVTATPDGETVVPNEIDNLQVEQLNQAADEVSTESTMETPIEGSQADLVVDVSAALQDQVAGTDMAPETALEQAPEAVSVEVAAAAASDQAASALAPSTNGSDGKTIEQLRAEQDALNRQINEKSIAERQAVITQIKSVVETYNIPVAELVEALGGIPAPERTRSKAKPKYRNTDGKEWSGRGKEPLWIKGQDRNQFLITE